MTRGTSEIDVRGESAGCAPTELRLPHGPLPLPAFLPDATLGVVRSTSAADLMDCGVRGLVMNTFHLMQRPGSTTVQALGGLHRMTGWPGPIVTDSGGFQAYSLIQQNARYGSMTNNGITVRPEGSDRKLQLTPEKTIQLQLSFDADIVICLDECTHVDAPRAAQEVSVRRTVEWARRCKQEFARLVEQKRLDPERRPLLFAVIQGGGAPDLRQRCAEDLLAIGFDGFGYGGWPLDSDGRLLEDVLAYTRSLIPRALPMHALGVGHPANVVACARMGYALFDSAMPTRDARHGRLYAFTGDSPALGGAGNGRDWFTFVHPGDQKHIKTDAPISPWCDCACCRVYSLGYLHHLFKVGDGLFMRLATIHNLRFMARLMERLRADGHA
jgi:queuine tRNA-ribosyltransferase